MEFQVLPFSSASFTGFLQNQLRVFMLRNGMLRKIYYYFGTSHKNDFALLNFEKRNVKTDIF